MTAVASANFVPIISRNALDEAIHDALRLYVGRGRRYSVKQLSNGTGVPDRMIESAVCPLDSTDFRPLRGEYLFSIMAFLGADFASELLAIAHLGAFDLPDEDMPPPGVLAADSATCTAEITAAAADGKFDHADKAHLKIVGQRDIARGMKLIALGTPRHQAGRRAA